MTKPLRFDWRGFNWYILRCNLGQAAAPLAAVFAKTMLASSRLIDIFSFSLGFDNFNKVEKDEPFGVGYYTGDPNWDI